MEIPLMPGNYGKNCPGNGKHYDGNGKLIECECDECNNFLLCIDDNFKGKTFTEEEAEKIEITREYYNKVFDEFLKKAPYIKDIDELENFEFPEDYE